MVGIRATAAVAVLTRAPSSGGKTRLFATLGRPFDAALLAALLLDTIDGASVPGTALAVFVEPGDRIAEVRALVPPDALVVSQHEGTLGQRMSAAMRDLFERGAGAVALVGSDLPALSRDAVAAAFTHLQDDPDALVLGPSEDGGYYLIASARPVDVFDDIEWGSGGVLAQTRSRAQQRGLRVVLLERGADVDTVEDLQRVVHDAPTERAPRTRAWARSRAVFTERTE